jgi:hypothetical protein
MKAQNAALTEVAPIVMAGPKIADPKPIISGRPAQFLSSPVINSSPGLVESRKRRLLNNRGDRIRTCDLVLPNQ